jgi:hypothetical protein
VRGVIDLVDAGENESAGLGPQPLLIGTGIEFTGIITTQFVTLRRW